MRPHRLNERFNFTIEMAEENGRRSPLQWRQLPGPPREGPSFRWLGATRSEELEQPREVQLYLAHVQVGR